MNTTISGFNLVKCGVCDQNVTSINTELCNDCRIKVFKVRIVMLIIVIINIVRILIRVK